MKNCKNAFRSFLIMTIFGSLIPLFGQSEQSAKQWQTEGFVGMGARLTPLYLNYNGFENFEEQNTLSGLSLTGGFNFTHKPSAFGFSLAGSLKRDYLYTTFIPVSSNCFGCSQFIEEHQKDWMADIHLGVYKYIPLGKNHLKLELGYSFMNIGTGYNTVNYGPDGKESEYINYAYNAIYADVSYRMRNVSFGLRTQYTPSSNLSLGNSLLSFEGRFIYHFGEGIGERKNAKPTVRF